MTLAPRWIICTVWKTQTLVPPKAEGEELQTKWNYFWTPLGRRPAATTTGNIAGIPASYATVDEAMKALKEVIKDQPELTRQDLLFTLLEVRYVPNKSKIYRQDWYDKYVLSEQAVELKEHKFVDTIK